MARFWKGAPQLFVLACALAGFCLVRPEVFARSPDLCLWRNLFHLPACPACGSTRALAAFFHSRFTEALAFNLNVIITAPALLGLLVVDLLRLFRKAVRGSFPT